MSKISEIRRKAEEFKKAADEFAEEQRSRDEALEKRIDAFAESDPNPFKGIWRLLKKILLE